jgi:pimeloyl-ACP methyl ester carboxylesterase
MPKDSDETPRKHVVILVHGIRTFGSWQDRLFALLKSSDPNIEIHIFKYKYLSALAFLVPPLRNRVVNRFREYLATHSEAWRGARVDIVSHSFGTYVVAQAIAKLPEGSLQVNTVILSGSVLQVTFPWNTIIRRRSVQRVVNDCGKGDPFPLIAQLIGWRLGIAGRYGFVGVTGSDVGLVNRYFPFGHSGFFVPTPGYKADDEFMEREWLPLLTSDQQPAGKSLVHPQARWFAKFEFAAEPLKVALLALGCLAMYSGYAYTSDLLKEAHAKTIIEKAEVFRQQGKPIEALVLLNTLDQEQRTNETHRVKEIRNASLEDIRQEAKYDSTYSKYWSRMWGSHGYFEGGLGAWSADRKQMIQSQSRNREIALVRPGFWAETKTLQPSCKTLEQPSISALNFGRDKILAATQSFIFVYDMNAKLVAQTCKWHTKDQWNYLKMIGNEALLLASANEGQIMLFKTEAREGVHELQPLTGEFDLRQSRSGAVIALQELPNTDKILTTHHLGSAFLWRLKKEPKPNLVVIHPFPVPPSRPKPVSYAFKLKTDDAEFITSAKGASVVSKQSAAASHGPTYHVTTYKAGPATKWHEATDGNIAELQTLAHDDATVLYARFSEDGSRIVTLACDQSLKIWDTETGAILASEKGTASCSPEPD